MGKRKRSSSSKKASGAENGAASSRAAASAEQVDVDADCVRYESSSEDSGNGMARLMEMQSKVFGWASDSDLGLDSDAEKQDEKENEFMRSIELSRSKADESDVELSVEFFDPRQEDVSSMSMLLSKYCKACTLARKGKGLATSADALARAVCAQTRVGTTIRLSDEEAPIGFISCLNVREHGKLLRDVKRKLVQVGEKQKNERFITLLNKCMEGAGRFESERMGLVLCERVVNMPTLVVAKMLEALSCEIEWATEDEEKQQQKDSFKFGWYLYIAEQEEAAARGEQRGGGGGEAGVRTSGGQRVAQARKLQRELGLGRRGGRREAETHGDDHLGQEAGDHPTSRGAAAAAHAADRGRGGAAAELEQHAVVERERAVRRARRALRQGLRHLSGAALRGARRLHAVRSPAARALPAVVDQRRHHRPVLPRVSAPAARRGPAAAAAAAHVALCGGERIGRGGALRARPALAVERGLHGVDARPVRAQRRARRRAAARRARVAGLRTGREVACRAVRVVAGQRRGVSSFRL
ncbi:protein BCCIP [Gracilaria domingensis]|nr:protein BCCIP [Gracilaria domingensis]